MKLQTLILLLTLLAAVNAVVKPNPKSEHRVGDRYRDELLHDLPNVKDAHLRVKMRCSSCKELSGHLFEKLNEVTNDAKRKNEAPAAHKYLTAIENHCTGLESQYGLVKISTTGGKATVEVSRKSDGRNLLKSHWVNRYILSRCSELVSKYEEDVLHEMKEFATVGVFQRVLCNQWEKSCNASDITLR